MLRDGGCGGLPVLRDGGCGAARRWPRSGGSAAGGVLRGRYALRHLR